MPPSHNNNSSPDVRSEEIRDIVDRMPTGWGLKVVVVLSILIALLTVISFAIKYPDTVDGVVTLTSEVAPIRLVSMVSGRLHLLKQPGTELQPEDVIAYIESGVDYNSILYLDSLLHWGITDSLPLFTRHIELGDLGGSYGAYVQAYTQWYRLKHSTRYKTLRDAMNKQVETDKKLANYIQSGVALQRGIIETSRDLLGKDSLLMKKGYLPEYEYRQSESNLLSQRSSLVNAEASHLSKKSEIQQTEIQILRSEVEEQETLEDALNTLEVRYQSLLNDVRVWKERYLFVSRASGVLDYLGFWRENTMIASGTEVFAIVPNSTIAIGEAIIPAQGAGKVKIGMDVNIKLNDYPYDEYGLLVGKVLSLSKSTNQTSSPNGNINTYRVRIALPNGLTTNFGYSLSPNLESKGTAEIVTKPRRLIERLFDNLKSKANK